MSIKRGHFLTDLAVINIGRRSLLHETTRCINKRFKLNFVKKNFMKSLLSTTPAVSIYKCEHMYDCLEKVPHFQMR
jgi:hypothetical protein